MMNKLKKIVLSVTAVMITLVAMSGASPASMWLIYEPDMPDSIKKQL